MNRELKKEPKTIKVEEIIGKESADKLRKAFDSTNNTGYFTDIKSFVKKDYDKQRKKELSDIQRAAINLSKCGCSFKQAAKRNEKAGKLFNSEYKKINEALSSLNKELEGLQKEYDHHSKRMTYHESIIHSLHLRIETLKIKINSKS